MTEGLEEILRKNTPLEDFDRDNFVNYWGAYQDANEYMQRLGKNPGDYKAKQDLCGLLFSAPGLAENLPLERVLDYGSRWLEHETEAMAAYSKNNLDTLLSKLKDKEVYSLAISLPAIKGVSKEHDKIAEIVNENREIAEAMKDPNKAVEYMRKQAEKCPQWFKEAYSPSDAKVFIELYAQYYQAKLQSLFVDRKGEIDTAKAEDFYKNNIQKAKEEYDEETDAGDKKDIMDIDLNQRFLALPQLAYSRQKKEKKYDKDPDREERKEERRNLGMAA